MLVAMRPSIVLLDEPSAGLAQAETEAMAPVLLETKRRLGCSMILIEHDMGLLRRWPIGPSPSTPAPWWRPGIPRTS